MLTGGRASWREPGGETRAAVFMGDFCPRDEGIALIEAGRLGAVFEEVKPFLAAADLRIIQWETPLTSQPRPIPKCGPNLNCPAATAAIVGELDLSVALLGNNHTGDQGDAAVGETIRHLRAAGARTVGAGETLAEAVAPLFLDCGGIRLALINCAEYEFGIAGAAKPGAAPLDPLRVLDQIRACRPLADQVWVTIHGGHEYNPFPSPRMQRTYRAFVEAGAALVFNCHTHCPEGIEIHRGAPIIYSPGNLYFPGTGDPGYVWWTGYLPKVFFDRTGPCAVEIEPYRFTSERLHVLRDRDREDFFDYFEEIIRPLADPDRLQQLFEAWSSRYGVDLMRHLSMLPVPTETLAPEARRPYLGARNLFTCESHRDVIRQALLLFEEGRLEAAGESFDEIRRLQHPSWLADRT